MSMALCEGCEALVDTDRNVEWWREVETCDGGKADHLYCETCWEDHCRENLLDPDTGKPDLEAMLEAHGPAVPMMHYLGWRTLLDGALLVLACGSFGLLCAMLELASV